jgi:hypothetical protein
MGVTLQVKKWAIKPPVTKMMPRSKRADLDFFGTTFPLKILGEGLKCGKK